MELRRTDINRREIKSIEGEFIWELKNSYELSPNLSEQILLTAKESLIREYQLKEGQIKVRVIGVEERSGKLIEKMEKKKVRLTIDNANEYIEAIKEITGRLIKVVIKYIKLYKYLNPERVTNNKKKLRCQMAL